MRLRFLDVETNLGPRRPIPSVCKILCSNVLSLAGNLSDLTVGSFQYDMLLCSETLVSDMRHVSELLVPDSVSLSCAWARCLVPEGWLHTYEMVTEHFANRNFSVVVAKWCFGVCGVRQNLFVFSLYRNPDLDDRIFDCLLASMAAVQAEDVCASFLFVCDLNGHRQEWLGSTTTNRHGVSAFDFTTVSGLRSVGCRPNPCTCWNTWPPDDCRYWSSTGCCCSTDR